MIKTIKTKYKTVKKLHHISDIQVRLIKRHAEYKEVFERLFSILEADKEDSVIFVTGDIVHTKTELSPELVTVTANFLKQLSQITTTIVIPGNHDANLNNRSRLDSLQPLTDLIANNDLHYIKNSGHYTVGDIDVSVMGIFDEQTEYIKADQIPDTNIKIALYHGTVNYSRTDTGFVFTNGDIGVDFFDGFDMVLLGDIHQCQQLQKYSSSKKKPEVWYCGSLIQQNHGESLNKGFLTWNVETRKPTFISVPNDFGYFTATIKDGKLVEQLSSATFPKKARLRVFTENTDMADIKRIVADIRKMSDVQEVTLNRVGNHSGLLHSGSNALIGDIRDVNYQNSLIVEHLNKTEVLEDSLIERIKRINADLNSKLPQQEMLPNIMWELKRFEFENMFSYGEGNYIDFSDMKGTVGIFAPNATGKSAILDALSFCLFDKSARAFKASEIVNNKKDGFVCKAEFQINDAPFFIERTASKRKYTEQTKVDVNFWTQDESNEPHSLNGEERRSTDDMIRSHIGSYEDFTLTALSVQGTSGGFIDKGQSDRKDLLSRFLGLNILEELYQLASKEISEVDALLKQFKKQDFTEQLAQLETELKNDKKTHRSLVADKKTLTQKRDKLNTIIVSLAKQMTAVDKSIVDIDKLERDKQSLTLEIVNVERELSELQERTSENKKTYLTLTNSLSKMDSAEIETQFDELCRLEHELEYMQNQVGNLKIDIGHKLEKLEKLKSHEYDPNCKYCMNNVFVKDAIRTQEDLHHDRVIVTEVVSKMKTCREQINTLVDFRTLNNTLKSLVSEKVNVERNQLQINAATSAKQSNINSLKSSLASTEDKIKRHHEMQSILEKNDVIETKLKTKQEEYVELEYEIESLGKKIQDIHVEIELNVSNRKTIIETMEYAKELEEQYSAYDYYLSSVKRDGIAYDLISKVIPEIEMEVNNILSQIVDFSLVWQLDGKNVNVFIAYDETNMWPLDLTSGMERFISNVAIRTALLSVSSLPRPNFLCIDEGFGVLDSDNINSVYLLFDYLKSRFDFILIITHLDTLKDVVDSIVEVKKDSEGFSVVNA
jgi:DNA repair exonuclease SbcCD ATPase subunit